MGPVRLLRRRWNPAPTERSLREDDAFVPACAGLDANEALTGARRRFVLVGVEPDAVRVPICPASISPAVRFEVVVLHAGVVALERPAPINVQDLAC
jgi:hypothetical protein